MEMNAAFAVAEDGPQAPPLQQHQAMANKNCLDDDELAWAWEIKEAIVQAQRQAQSTSNSSNSSQDNSELLPHIPVPDYEIAQMAVITLGVEDLHSVLERVLQLQCLKEEYRLHDTPEEGVELMGKLCKEQQPGHILALDLSPDQSSYIGVFDFARNKPSAVDSPEDWRVYLGAYYYILGASCANLGATREGFVTIVECDGMGYHTFSHSMQQRWAQELGMHYPVKSKESLWLNTPMVANVMCAFVKPWMNARHSRWDKIKLGCKMDWYDGRIDALMNVPSAEIALEKLLRNLKAALEERFHNYKTYVLPPRPFLDEEGAGNGMEF